MRLVARIAIFAAVLLIIFGAGSAYGYFSSSQAISGNRFTVDHCWTQANSGGILSNTVLDGSGNIVLATQSGSNYYLTGNYTSQVFNTTKQNTIFDMISWNASTSSGVTNIVIYYRTSNTAFANNSVTPAWVMLGSTSPVTAGLQPGEYVQWRAVLTTTSKKQTPTLRRAEAWYQ